MESSHDKRQSEKRPTQTQGPWEKPAEGQVEKKQPCPACLLCACDTKFCVFYILQRICSAAWVLDLEMFFLISTAVHIRSFISHHPTQCVSILYIIPTGHGIWSGSFPEHPPYDVPDENGNFLSPVLSGFYMFLTMIILLQVKDKASLLPSRKKVLKPDYNQ